MTLLTLDPWQQSFLDCVGDKILCCGRQVGKSVIAGMDAGEWSATHFDMVVLMIAPTERQAFALFNKTLTYLVDHYPRLIKKGKDRPTKTKINLSNGTEIWCLPTGISGLGVRFLTVDRLYRDEDSRIPREVSAAVDPMLMTTGGDTIRLSTPYGTDNDFADVVQNKDGAYDSYTRFSVDSRTVIEDRKICSTWTLKQREKAILHLDREKKRKSELDYAQEYEGKLVDDIKQYFSDDLIRSLMEDFVSPPLVNCETFLGADIAGMGRDDIVLYSLALYKDSFYEIGLEIYKKQRTTVTTRCIITSDNRFDYLQIYVDDGGMGVGVFDQLLDEDSTRRKVTGINNSHRSIDNNDRQKKLIKEDLYSNTLVLMERGRLKLRKNDTVFHALKSVQKEYVGDQLRIAGTHISEALIRACWGIRCKRLNIWISY